MSQELRNNQGGERGINRMANGNSGKKNYEGFEGMNYEQIRGPYDPNYISRNRTKAERKEGKRPDKG